jgi:hypothetical protein
MAATANLTFIDPILESGRAADRTEPVPESRREKLI